MSATQYEQRAIQQSSVAARWLISAVFALALSSGLMAAPTPESFPAAAPNGPVLTSASFGSHTGGSVGHGIGMDATTALLDNRFPKVTKGGGGGDVLVIIGDTLGGWVIGGDFDNVGGVALTNLAHIQADFTVNSGWRPNPDNVVRALSFHTGAAGLRLLVGGDFTQIHGTVSRSYFAELNTASVSKPVTDLDLALNGPVRAIVANAGTAYIGGDFTTVQGTGPRDSNGDGQMDVDIGGTVYVDMDGNGTFERELLVVADSVFDIDVDGDGDIDIDVTGDGNIDVDIDVDFQGLDTPPDVTYPGIGERQRIAALDLSQTSNAMVVTDWNPNVGGSVIAPAIPSIKVMALSPDRGILYIGGTFTEITVGTVTKNRASIAALNIDTELGIVTPWNPGPTIPAVTPSINAMSLEESALDDDSGLDIGLLYVGGLFDRIGDQVRQNFAALDVTLAVNNANPWNIEFNGGEVDAIARTDEAIFIGGSFTSVKSGNTVYNSLQNLASMDRNGGALLTSWKPVLNGPVSALAVEGNTLYVGGRFSTIDDGSRFYIGGNFTDVGGALRDYLAAFDSSSGALISSFDVGLDGLVNTILLSYDGSILYVGGSFSAIGGQLRNNLAALNTATGIALAWNPNVNGPVHDLKFSPSGELIYVAGAFTQIGGETRNNIGAVNVESGDETAWDPSADGTIYSMELSGDTVYIGGDFLRLNTNGQNVARSRLAAINTLSNVDNAITWAPAADDTVREMALYGTTLYIAGDFLNLNDTGLNRPRGGIAALDTTANAFNVLSWNPDADGAVNAITLTEDAVFVGGDFANVGGEAHGRLAALDFISGQPFSWWNLSADNIVQHLATNNTGDRMIIAGDFTQVTSPGPPVVNSGSRLATVDVGFPHVVANLPPGAYQDPLDTGALPADRPSVTLSCIDTPRDCTTTVYYTVDGSDPVIGGVSAQPLVIGANTVLKTIVEDDDGNRSPIQTMLYVIDTLPPSTVATPAGPMPDGVVLSSNDERMITLVCTDTGTDGTEETAAGCIETYYTIDGSDPTTESTRYVQPIAINEDTTLKYFSIDQAGNSELDATAGFKTERYLVDINAPTVFPDPPTQIFFSDRLTVTLLCSDEPGITAISVGDIPRTTPDPNAPPPVLNNTVDDVKRTETGCAAIYYTLDESTPTQASTLYTGPFSFSESTVVKYIAVDFAGNEGAVERASYVRNYSDNVGATGPSGIGLVLLPWLCWRYRRNYFGVNAAHSEERVV